MYRQVGNAVPVLFAAQLGKQFAEIERWLETEKIA
jgi:site-specific DNA-cytosine methylase